MTPVQRSWLCTVAVVSALLGIGAALWIVGLSWNAPAWLAIIAGLWLAVAALWRRAWQVIPTGAERTDREVG